MGIHLLPKKTTIFGKDGEHDTPYMTRIVWWRFRLHIFYRGDPDRDYHDHPFGFWTFPIASYDEEVLTFKDFKAVRKINHVKRFRWHYRPASHIHRVIGRSDGAPRKFVTLLWRERRDRGTWNFYKVLDGKEGYFTVIPWQTYIFGEGRDAFEQREKGASSG